MRWLEIYLSFMFCIWSVIYIFFLIEAKSAEAANKGNFNGTFLHFKKVSQKSENQIYVRL